MLSSLQLDRAKDFIYRNGRLLERKLYEHFFEGGSERGCMRALLAYQNAGGGFGNGLEPDLLCPDSTAIGAESAMCMLDMTECQDRAVVNDIVEWIVASMNESGYIEHPPVGLAKYPHQPWWKNPDDSRILVLAGMLQKWGIKHPELYRKVRSYYLTTELPAVEDFYGYPHLVYLRYCGQGAEDEAKLSRMLTGLPMLLKMHADHFPLFGRHWYHAADLVDAKVLRREAEKFVGALQDDGGVNTPYPDLPWWRPIWTLDGLMLLKRASFI